MTTDLWMLVFAVLLQWALILAASLPKILANGMEWAVGNRETDGVEVSPVAGRVKRTSDNMAENLILFSALVLVAHVSGEADDLSARGAQVFLGARVVHAIIYIAGIPVGRTLAWVVSLVGLAMIVAAIA